MGKLEKFPAMPRLSWRQRMGLRLAGLRSSQSNRDFFKGRAGQHSGMNTREPLHDPYSQHPVVNACVRAYADNISSVPFKIYKAVGRTRTRLEFNQARWRINKLGQTIPRDPTRKQGFEVVEGIDLNNLFDNPDPRLGSASLFWEATVTYMLKDGECVCVAQERNNIAQVPKEIWTYTGKQFTVKTKLNGIPTLWSMTTAGARKDIPDYQLIRPRLLDPNNLLRGIAPYQAGEISAQTDWYALLYNRNFFQNGAVMGGVVLAPPGMTKEQRKAFYDGYKEKHGGVDNVFSVGLLAGATDFKEMGTTQRDMQFTAQRKYTREELAMLYRVPLTVLSTYEQVNYANARVQSRAFWQLGLLPTISHIEDIYWAQFFKWIHGGKYWGAFDLTAVEALQEDLAEKLDNAKKYFDLMFAPNAINERLELGMEATSWGDTRLVPVNVIPADAAVGVGGQEPAGLPQPPAPPSAASQATQAVEKRAVLRLSKTQKQAQWGTWIDTIQPYERRYKAAYKKYLFDLRKRQLTIIAGYEAHSRARQVDPATAQQIADALLFNQTRWNAALAEATRPVVTDTLIASAAQLSDSIGGNMLFNLTDPAVMQFISKKEILLMETNTTLRNNLKAQLLEGMANGETVGQLQDRIRGTFNFQESRSLTIARTETAQAAGHARHGSMVAEGVGGHSWLTAMDEAVRASHVEAEAEGVIPINQSFMSTGLLHPSQMGGSAAEIINCRCVELVED